ncbi:hypothetical protein FRB90_011340 [Tulasnella sp. 427]|nr:hypothetical protein FRB90_011340 [Tulasnella sp. 427]
MVRFERNWSKGNRGVQRTSTFRPDPGYPIALLPGGRWHLAWSNIGTGGVLFYDFDAEDVRGHMLIPRERERQMIQGIDFALNDRSSTFEFHLAFEFVSPEQLSPWEQSEEPRKLTIWKVRLDEAQQLNATPVYSIPVFRLTPLRDSTSLDGHFLLRASLTASHHSVFTVHKWMALKNDETDHLILRPQRKAAPKAGVKLLPDGRIISISNSWVEIYPPPDLPWKESLIVPENVPQTHPQWVYKYPSHLYDFQQAAFRLVDCQDRGHVLLSIHNGEKLFDVRIPIRDGAHPQVTSTTLTRMEGSMNICLGTSRAVLATIKGREATFMTFSFRRGMQRLRAFAGVQPDILGTTGLNEVETQFFTPIPARAEPWRMDERSGRVLSHLGTDTDGYTCIIFYFVD